MQTLADVERRFEEIKVRINQILVTISEAPTSARPTNMSDLAEEMAILLHESKVLAASMQLAREMTESLVNTKCSGPH